MTLNLDEQRIVEPISQKCIYILVLSYFTEHLKGRRHKKSLLHKRNLEKTNVKIKQTDKVEDNHEPKTPKLDCSE